FYVFGHLSKWFTFSVFLSVIFCRVVVFYACTQLTYLYNKVKQIPQIPLAWCRFLITNRRRGFLFFEGFWYLPGCKSLWLCYCCAPSVPVCTVSSFRFRADAWHNCAAASEV